MPQQWQPRRLSAVLIAALGTVCAYHPAFAFTQSGLSFGGFGNGIPMGHEWVTRMAGVELMGYVPPAVPDVPDPKDPRKTWTKGLAKNTNLSSPGAQAELKKIKSEPWNDSRYLSRYKAVYDAIVGERWVDLAGYNALTSQTCWDAVAQEPADIQYDHFMRRYDDRGDGGGVTAAKTSQQRFAGYFVAAAMANSDQMSAYDGGATGSTAVSVDRNYFLFGRAVHQFEDSFSLEHTVRIADDNYVRVRQVKSYICAAGSEQHSHSRSAIRDFTSGDVIWRTDIGSNPAWSSYKASNMKDNALVATEAMKDLWAAFIRVMGTPRDQRQAAAQAEAATLVTNWLGYDENEMKGWYDNEANRGPTYVKKDGESGKGQSVKDCMKALDVGFDDQDKYVKQLEKDQRKCLYNAIPWVGYQDLFDTQLHIWYSWRWRNGPAKKLLDPPNDWKIQDQPADTGVHVQIKSVDNDKYMTAPDGLKEDAWVYCKNGTPPIDFVMVGDKDEAYFRVAQSPLLFLSYRGLTGAVKLWNPYTLPVYGATSYKVQPAKKGWSLKDKSSKDFMWLSDKSPYITHKGDPDHKDSQWEIDGLK